MVKKNANLPPRYHKFAFTLAEILITLGIVGVISALTIPNLITNYQKAVTVTKLKKEYSKISQLLLNSLNDNGAPTREMFHSGDEYIKTYWLQYLKFPRLYNSAPYNKTSNNNIYFKCYSTMSGTEKNFYVSPSYRNQGFYMFSDNDVIYYLSSNWDTQVYSILIDINGTNGPNILGKDIFQFGLDIENGKLSGRLSNAAKTDTNAYFIYQCKYYGSDCTAKIIRDGWIISNDYPW